MGSALLCITRKNPVASALWLVVTLFALAALFVLLDAQFIAVLQILVYAGAIMVLFLFVIMLLNLGRPGPTDIRGPAGLLASIQLPPGTVQGLQEHQGIIGAVANPLFDAYLIPFEIASVLLLAAIVGAVVLAKRKL